MGLFLIGLTLIGWQVLRERYGAARWTFEPGTTSIGCGALLLGVVLPLSVFAQQLLDLHCALHVSPVPAFVRAFPLHLLANSTAVLPPRMLESAAACAIVAIQAWSLWKLLGCDPTRLKIPLPVCVALIAVVSIGSPVLSSSDPYFYVAASILGTGSYQFFHPPFTGEFRPLNTAFFVGGTIYGPAWLQFNHVVLSLGRTFLEKLEILRVQNALLLCGCYFLLRRCNVNASVRLIFLVNPFVWYFFVATPHNDLLALVTVVAAIALMGRAPAWSIAAVALAGLMKLPFLLVGSVAFGANRSFATRCAAIAASGALCIAVSALVGGHDYLHALLSYGKQKAAHWDPAFVALVSLSFLTFAALTLAAATLRKWYAGTPLLAAASSPFPFGWYALWGLPYALADGSSFAPLLAAYPIVGFFLSEWYASFPYSCALFGTVLVYALVDVRKLARARGAATRLQASTEGAAKSASHARI